MKLAVAIADAKAGPSAFVVWRGFAESIKKAADYGYDGVELALRTKDDVDVPALRGMLSQHQLGVSCISTGQVFADLGLYLTNVNAAERTKAVDIITGLVELADEFGGMVNLGRTRGFVPRGQTEAQTTEIFLDSLSRILPKAEQLGVTVVIEPVNRYEINFINTVPQCTEVLQRLHSSHVGVMPDVFHMNIEDASIGGSLRACGDMVKYIHLADSNRRAPGWGHLDFDEVFSALADIDYDAWASVEILPLPGPDVAAKQAADYLLPRLKAYNSRAKG